MNLSQLKKLMNKLTSYSVLAVLTILILSLGAMHSKASLDVQWGKYQRLRISPGAVTQSK